MYITLSDRPQDPERHDPHADAGGDADPPRPVGRVVLLLGAVSLLTDISTESVAAILPLYLTTVVGISAVAYGFVDGLYQGVSALVRVGGGWLADRTERPLWVAFAGYALSAVARIFLLFAAGLGSVASVVTADRIGKGIRTAPRDAMISAATPPGHLGRAFGVHRMMDTVGAALGPLLAFAILWLIPDGYSTVLVVSLAFALVGVALLGLFGPEAAPRAPKPEQGPVQPPFRWRDLTAPRLRRLLWVAAGLGVLTVGDGFLYLALLDQGDLAIRWFPLLYVGTNIVYLALAIPLGRVADRIGRARMLVLGHLALVGAYVLVVAPTSAVVATLGTLLLLGTFYAATDGVIAALAGTLVPTQARTSGIAAAQTVVAVARMGASFGFGLLWFQLGPAAALVLVAGLLLLGVLASATQVSRLDTRGAVA